MSNRKMIAAMGTALMMAAALASATTASAQNRRAARAPTAEQNVAAAQVVATAAGLSCQVTEATLLGKTDGDNADFYEAACATGPGYLLVASTPPQSFDCVLLAAQARDNPAATPAEATPTCKLAANQNTDALIAGYAQAAGVPCTIDAGAPVGLSEGKTVYEVGCPGTDGYRIEEEATGWTKSACLTIVSAGGTCRFTTPDEQYASVKTMLANTEGAACVVDGARHMGGNANGQFYEAKCSGSEGYILRVKDNATEQVYRCAIAQPIGGGCTLTPKEVSDAAEDARAAQ